MYSYQLHIYLIKIRDLDCYDNQFYKLAFKEYTDKRPDRMSVGSGF